MKDKQDIIEKYKLSLVDNYYYYLEIINELNLQIPSFTSELKKTGSFNDINVENVIPFNYPDFCRSFLLNLDAELSGNTTFDKHSINNIFMIMVEDKILESSSSSSNESTL
jgi:hypothetical protein